MTSLTRYDIQLEEVINRTKFGICSLSSFGGVKRDGHTDTQT